MRTTVRIALTLSMLALAMVPQAFADEHDAEKSITANPLGLLVGYANAQYEINAEGPKSWLLNAVLWHQTVVSGSLSGIGLGAGQRRYFKEDFTGFYGELSGQVVYMSYGVDNPLSLEDEGSSVIFAAGPLLGYKWILDSSLTLEVGGGVQLGVGNVGGYKFGGVYGALTAGIGYSW